MLRFCSLAWRKNSLTIDDFERVGVFTHKQFLGCGKEKWFSVFRFGVGG